MPVARKPRARRDATNDPAELVKRLRSFHGWDIKIFRQGQTWWLEIPELTLKHSAGRRGMMTFLLGYQYGWTAGRRYTGGEQTALRGLIRELKVTA